MTSDFKLKPGSLFQVFIIIKGRTVTEMEVCYGENKSLSRSALRDYLYDLPSLVPHVFLPWDWQIGGVFQYIFR